MTAPPKPNATSSPVYAVVNKANKRKLKTESAPTPQPFPNYCNVEVGLTGKPPICPPREPYYENSRQVVSRMKQVMVNCVLTTLQSVMDAKLFKQRF